MLPIRVGPLLLEGAAPAATLGAGVAKLKLGKLDGEPNVGKLPKLLEELGWPKPLPNG